jgi:hypothetical protein
LILIFVFDFFVGKNFTMRTNNTVAHSSRGRTIIPMEAAIAGAASRRGKGNGARGSRGGGGAATAPRGGRGAATAPRGGGAVIAPRGGRARRLEFISVEEGLQQPQEDTYDRDEEEENVAEAHENDERTTFLHVDRGLYILTPPHESAGCCSSMLSHVSLS